MPKTGISNEIPKFAIHFPAEKPSLILSYKFERKIVSLYEVLPFESLFSFTCARIHMNQYCGKSAVFFLKKTSNLNFSFNYLLNSSYQNLNGLLQTRAKPLSERNVDSPSSNTNFIVRNFPTGFLNCLTCRFLNSCFSITTALIWSRKNSIESSSLLEEDSIEKSFFCSNRIAVLIVRVYQKVPIILIHFGFRTQVWP